MDKGSSKVILQVEEFLINEMGQYFEGVGGKTLMGRVWGLLMTRSQAVSLKELSSTLRVSKSALSYVLIVLVQLKLIKKIYVPEFPRESFYVLEGNAISMIIDPGVQKMNMLLEKIENALEILKSENSQSTTEYKELYRRINLIYLSMKVVLDEYSTLSDKIKAKINKLQKDYKDGKI